MAVVLTFSSVLPIRLVNQNDLTLLLSTYCVHLVSSGSNCLVFIKPPLKLVGLHASSVAMPLSQKQSKKYNTVTKWKLVEHSGGSFWPENSGRVKSKEPSVFPCQPGYPCSFCLEEWSQKSHSLCLQTYISLQVVLVKMRSRSVKCSLC